ncbi:MAG TPA: EamA family transporter [Anaerolineae bacterium]
MNRKDTMALLVLSAIWGSSYLFIAIGTEALPPLTLVTIRLLIGAAALHTVLLARRRPLPRSRKTLAALAFMGLSNNIIPFALIAWSEAPGLHQVNSGLAAVLVAAVPIFTVILAHFALHDERFTALKVSGVLIGFVGVAVLMSPRFNSVAGKQAILGALAVIAASIAYAIAAIFSRRMLGGVQPILIGAIQMTWSVVLLLPVALLVERPSLANVPLRAWFAVGWLGLLGSGIAYILYFGLIQRIGATQTTMVAYISPIVAVILGAVFNEEQIEWALLAGMVLIIGGAVLVNRRPQPRPAPDERVAAPVPDALEAE